MLSPTRSASEPDEMKISTAGEDGRAPIQKR